MKRYVTYFRWLLLVLVIFSFLYVAVLGLHYIMTTGERTRENAEILVQERVFDHAEVLTPRQEEKLSTLIEKRQKQTGCDIVLVTLNESLEEYARAVERDVTSNEYVRVYAADFFDENFLGYNQPSGDGVILVDNWYRESDGKVHTWFYPSGKVSEKYDAGSIDHLLYRVYQYIEISPYLAYKTYINSFYHDMTGINFFTADIPGYLPFILSLIAGICFIAVNWKSKAGKKTTEASAYVIGGEAIFNKKEDILISKTVTSMLIETPSSGTGGRSTGGNSGSSGGGRSR